MKTSEPNISVIVYVITEYNNNICNNNNNNKAFIFRVLHIKFIDIRAIVNKFPDCVCNNMKN